MFIRGTVIVIYYLVACWAWFKDICTLLVLLGVSEFSVLFKYESEFRLSSGKRQSSYILNRLPAIAISCRRRVKIKNVTYLPAVE